MEQVKEPFNLKKVMSWLISLGVPTLIMMVPVTEVFTTEIRSFCVITIMVILLMACGLFNTMFLGMALPILYTICHVTTRQTALSA